MIAGDDERWSSQIGIRFRVNQKNSEARSGTGEEEGELESSFPGKPFLESKTEHTRIVCRAFPTQSSEILHHTFRIHETMLGIRDTTKFFARF